MIWFIQPSISAEFMRNLGGKMTTNFFDNIQKWQIERNGTQGLLPAFYFDNLFLTGVYSASTKRVRELIPHTDLHPVELWPGRCLVAFTAFEYRKPEIEPYNEFSISFIVRYKKIPIPIISAIKAFSSSVLAVYVWQLPVTTEAARTGGVDFYNYPKFLSDIRFIKTKDTVTCILKDSNTEILRMIGKIIPTKEVSPIRYVSYTVMQNNLLAINTLVNPLEFGVSNHNDDVVIQIENEHPLGQEINKLGLGKHPLSYQFSPRNESILFPARNVRDL